MLPDVSRSANQANWKGCLQTARRSFCSSGVVCTALMPTPEVTQVSQGYTVRPGLKTGALLSRLWIQEDTKAILFFFMNYITLECSLFKKHKYRILTKAPPCLFKKKQISSSLPSLVFLSGLELANLSLVPRGWGRRVCYPT